MTKDSYYDMCTALSAEPIESEIPLDLTDFPTEYLVAWEIYQAMRPIYNAMSGDFEGRDTSVLETLFNIYNVPGNERQEIFKIIRILEEEYRELGKASSKASSKK